MTSKDDKDPFQDIPCHLCGSWEPKILYVRKVSSKTGASEWTQMTRNLYGDYGSIVRCKKCRLVYQSPCLSNESIVSAYTTMADQNYVSEQDCRGMNAFLSLRIIKKFVKRGRLLDVGCSTGFFLNSARPEFDLQGIEPSHWAVQFAKERLKLNVTQGTLETADFPPGTFDVVSMVDVIEHLSNPKPSLKKVSKFLKKDGLLYLVTPDIGSLSAFVMGRYWWGFRPSHLVYFSKKTMVKLLSEVGFEVIRMNSYGRIFSVNYWVSRIKNYPRPLYWLVDSLVRWFGFGEKVVYINTRDSMEICARKIES